MVQLAEPFRGSKSKSATKWLQVSELKGFGAGSKYSKPDIDRIAHAMVHQKILLEVVPAKWRRVQLGLRPSRRVCSRSPE